MIRQSPKVGALMLISKPARDALPLVSDLISDNLTTMQNIHSIQAGHLKSLIESTRCLMPEGSGIGKPQRYSALELSVLIRHADSG